MSKYAYDKVLKMGQKEYRRAVAHGEYPYLPALDDILSQVSIMREENLGVVDIPVDQIVGTKTVGRQHAFASNFMPLMKEDTEFAYKWRSLYEFQEEEGIKDTIIAYEFMNKFYVLEGNKRVSVFKYLNAPVIEGRVTRIVPYPNDTLENKVYFEFLEFYKKTRINYIQFSSPGKFEALMKATGNALETEWNEDERRLFSSNYNSFKKLYLEKGGSKLDISTGDAFLFYLSLYPYSEIANKSFVEIRNEIGDIWKELTELGNAPGEALVMKPEENDAGLLSRLVNITTMGITGKKYKIGFIYDRTSDNSGWSYGHELGRTHLEDVLKDKVETKVYCCQASGLDVTELIEQAIADGCQAVFTTHQRFLGASLKAAIEHPDVRILNCSVNRPYTSIRTYYGRMYEAKFLCGMLAGAMCENDKIAYCADYPIYGSLAGINAFAIGAKMTNPRAKVYLHWSSRKDADFDMFLTENDISMISDNDMIRPNGSRRFGLYLKKEDEYQMLATPIWDWGKFYERITQELMNGSWKSGTDGKGRKAINYWWGISSGIIDLIMSNNIDIGIKRLIWIMRDMINNEVFQPFNGILYSQEGKVVLEDGKNLTPEQIITMDWLVDSVIGEVPDVEELTEEAKKLVMMQKSQVPTLE